MESMVERFVRYTSINTRSNEESTTIPSTQTQVDFATNVLVPDLKAIGLDEVIYNRENGFVIGTLNANTDAKAPSIGFIAHMDTVSDFADHAVNPVVHENYDGKDLKLSESGRTLETAVFPHLASLAGKTLITSDGTTVLGADDKAGVAEIMTLAEALLAGEFPHGQISIAFTPDEEIARGAKHFDVEGFGADYAYTLDGDEEGEIQFENFNASTAFITIHGVSVHTGSAKDVMVNSQTIATEIHQMLPVNERPETTEGYEGFYHLVSVQGNVTTTKMKYFIRDFDRRSFDARAQKLRDIAEEMNKKYGEGKVEVEIVESYYNMREKIEPCMQLIDYAKAAIEHAGITPIVSPVRGGTDGARLSFKGLPCPNLGTGGHAFHGVFEHITVEGMDKAVLIVKDIIRQFAE